MEIMNYKWLTLLGWFCYLPVAHADYTPDFTRACAKWLTTNEIVWELAGNKHTLQNRDYQLYHGDIEWHSGKIIASGKIKLELASAKNHRVVLNANILSPQIADLLYQQLVVAASDDQGKIVAATALQTGGVIDELYAYAGDDLGITFQNGIPRLKLWAPTARKVRLHLFIDESSAPQIFTMQRDAKGVWSIVGETQWQNRFYLYEVTVFTPATSKVETNLVTDPYSVSLSANGHHSQIVDLDSPALKPKGWDTLTKPPVDTPEDIVLYELHLRDFSIGDTSVPDAYRGTYLAFTIEDSNGMKHLRHLAQSGLTHVHLLPIFDIATIEEHKHLQLMPSIPNDAAADSPRQQTAVGVVRDRDGFNWGYDPHHYNAPEGSYATDPQGSMRILELRHMVQALNNIGLRVIMDVVYNHTHACGQNSKSVLDKIVPGYYHRFDSNGNISHSSCCPDTASERIMMEKLMIDSLRLWAKHYKIDGFRFDLMGHHSKDNMQRIKKALHSLTLAKDGVDGNKIYLYGEGWRFGSLNDIAPEQAFHQFNTYGCGIGTFNDRIRDSVRGGNFQHSSKSDQGFVNGLYYDYNKEAENVETSPNLELQKARLLNYTDNIRLGMVGNLRDYRFVNCEGKVVTGRQISYRGSPAGYTAAPVECINYVSAHDNYTLWDQITAKAPFHKSGRTPPTATAAEKQRMQYLALSIVMLGQGIPFFHAGIEMLRSKSGDGDSYNSGDWFNRIDFTYHSNNWGVGLPPAWKNANEWNFWQRRLAELAPPDTALIRTTVTYFQALLQIRRSSRLFRLRSAQQIQDRVRFLNAQRGKKQLPGLIIMSLEDNLSEKPKLDRRWQSIVVAINANQSVLAFSMPQWQQMQLRMHPVLTTRIDPQIAKAHFDMASGTLSIPGRTTVVYVVERN